MGSLIDWVGDAVNTVTGKAKKMAQDPNAGGQSTAEAEQGYNQGLALKQNAQSKLDSYAQQMQAIAAKRAGYAQNLGGQFDKQTQAGVGQIRSNVARSLAAGQAAGAGDDSGQNYGALLQAGVSGGQAVGNYIAQQGTAREQAVQQAQGLADSAQSGAAEASYNAAETARKIGTSEDDRNALRAQAEAQISQIIKNNKGTFFDYEGTMATQIRNYAYTIGDPVLRQEFLARADRIENGSEDV